MNEKDLEERLIQDAYLSFTHTPKVPEGLSKRRKLEEYTLEELMKMDPEENIEPLKENVVCSVCHHYKYGPEIQIKKKKKKLKHRCPEERKNGCLDFSKCPTRRRDLHTDMDPFTHTKVSF